MTQKDLARELATSQNAIYRLENPRYGKPNISTLKKLAIFFDVGLVVRFAPFSEIADWTRNLSEASLDVPDFEHDNGFMERKGPHPELRISGSSKTKTVKSRAPEEFLQIQNQSSFPPERNLGYVAITDAHDKSLTERASYG